MTVIEIFARSTRIIKNGSVMSRLKTFGKNVLLGNDTEMQDLVAKLDKLTQSEHKLVGAESLMEVKRTGRLVDSIEGSMNEQTAQLSHLAISSNEVSAGVGQILGTLEQSRTDSKAEKDVKHLEAVKRFLNPSITAQDRFDEIRREHVPGSGDWIRSEEQLRAWVDSAIPILWVSGFPGSGKSFLTYNIISYLQDIHKDAGGHAAHTSVGYFFFRDNKDQTRSFERKSRPAPYSLGVVPFMLLFSHIRNTSY